MSEPNANILIFRRSTVEALVGNTCDNVHDTGNSIGEVSIAEAAAYHLVCAAYHPEDVACELAEMAIVLECGDDALRLSKEELKAASLWDEEDVKVQGVNMLRAMTMPPGVREALQECSDTIEGLFDDANPWPEKSELLSEIDRLLDGEGKTL
jgi:hypothetical protein